jgi:hypothetical protein
LEANQLGRNIVTSKLIKIATFGALALVPTLTYAQNAGNSGGAVGADNPGAVATDPSPSQSGEKSHIQKQTNPKKNGTMQSETPGGEMKNGQPQK